MKRAVALVAFLTLVSAPSAAELGRGQVPAFAAAHDYRIAQAGQSVASGDLNGDGNRDVVATHGTDFPPNLNGLRSVSVLLNRGAGRLRPEHLYPTGDAGDELGAWSVAIGDLTGDGRPDLATANPGGRSVSVLVNRGAGDFEPPINYSIDRQPWDVAIADLDGDGKLDIATANPNTVSVLLNKGDGSFGTKSDYATGGATWAFVVGDVNGDGKPDFATANYSFSAISVLVNRGDGTFARNVDYRTGLGPRGIAIGDVNGDRKLDLVTANGTSNPVDSAWLDSVSVLLNRGDGTFRPRRTYRMKSDQFDLHYITVRIGDMNGDRRPDIVTADGEEWTISVLLNNGSGRFGTRFDYGPLDPGEDAGGGAEALALADLSGHGRLDVVTAKWDRVSVFINSPGLCTVPDVRWILLSAARRKLARMHCRVGSTYRRHDRERRGWVIKQNPPVGTVLPKGGRVNLVISRGRRSS